MAAAGIKATQVGHVGYLALSSPAAPIALFGAAIAGLPSVEIEIRDDVGKPVAPETVGRVHVRGPQVSGEYGHANLRDPEGWFDTRDRGYQDADGFLFLDGRADDVIVRAGKNISPGEIEEV